MLAKFRICILVFICFWFTSYAYSKVGIIVTKEDESLASFMENALKKSRNFKDIRILPEIIEKEDAVNYQGAFCRLISQGIIALISPASEPHNSLLIGYSYEYQIPFITTELHEITSGLSSPYAISIQPSTTRAILGLFQHHGWRDVVYLYDHEYGPEKLQLVFLLGHRVLNLTLDGILKVHSAEQANWYLQMLDRFYGNKLFHVILDTDPNLARDIIWRHINDINVRKKNFHFLLSQPTPDHFWTSEKTAFRPVNVTTFVINNQILENAKSGIQEASIKESKHGLNMLSYYYYDALLVVDQAIKILLKNGYRLQANLSMERDCFKDIPSPIINSDLLARTIKEINIRNGATGKIQFQDGLRTNFDLNITQITSRGYYKIGTWTNGILHIDGLTRRDLQTALPLVQDNGRLRITTIISPPYMMLKKTANISSLTGNDRFEGYLKDVIDLIAEEMNIEYELNLAEEDGIYGKYDKSQGKWTGAIGDIIQGKVDLVVADLAITGQRQRVVDFTDPFQVIGFSLVLKNPLSIPPTSIFFFVTAFSLDAWICIILLIIIFGVLFHVITMFTGAPDSIESASGIWGRKPTIIVNAWFTAGSSLLQGTGVYPRSISSRVLSGVFWLFTLILSSLFIASMTAQILMSQQLRDNNPKLSQLKDMSLESIISEAVSRGWPKVGLIYPSSTAVFIKKSRLPTYMKFAEYLEKNPDVMVSTVKEGLKKVRESAGNYMFLLESTASEYAVRQKPCDIIATHDSIHYSGYGFATPLGSQWTLEINKALTNIQNRGALGSLHRKWWIDSSECKNPTEEMTNERTIHMFTGLISITAFGFLIILAVFGIQYIRKNQNKESRRQQLSFEDMNLGQSFPAPPPELLGEPAPVLNLPEYDRKTLL